MDQPKIVKEIVENRYRDVEDMLNKRSQSFIEELDIITSSTEIDEEEFRPISEAGRESIVNTTRTELHGSYDALKKEHKEKEDEKDKCVKHLSGLEDDIRAHEKEPIKKAARYVKYLYGAVIAAAIIIAAKTMGLIMPEQAGILSWLQAIIMAGPSYFIAAAWQKCRDKVEYQRRLNIAGLVSAIVMAVSATIARTLAYYSMNQTGSGSFLSGSSVNWIDQLQLAFAGLPFIGAIAVEITLAGALLISMKDSGEAKEQLDQKREHVEQLKQHIEGLKTEWRSLGKWLGQIDNFDDIALPWMRKEIGKDIIRHRALQEEIVSEAMRKIQQRSKKDIIRMSK
jgi:hypothetical protein